MASTGNTITSIVLQLPLQAAGTDRKIHQQVRLTGDWEILAIDFMPDDAAAVGATNFTTVSLENETSGVVLHTFDNDTGGTAFVVGTNIPLATAMPEVVPLMSCSQTCFPLPDLSTATTLPPSHLISVSPASAACNGTSPCDSAVPSGSP